MRAVSSKYAEWGDYHWRQFARPSIYRSHVLHVQNWITVKAGIDVGCGDGLITSRLPDWIGVDPDLKAVELARKHGVKAAAGNVYTLSGQFPAVYLGDVLEHLARPGAALEQIAMITDRLFLATPPRKDKPRPLHVQEWTKDELLILMEDHGWKLHELIVTRHDRMYGQFTR